MFFCLLYRSWIDEVERYHEAERYRFSLCICPLEKYKDQLGIVFAADKKTEFDVFFLLYISLNNC